jgi:hypothetical protein
VTLGVGGTYRITFRVEILTGKFKNGREIQKTDSKIQKNGLENSKKSKNFRHYVANVHFIQCLSGLGQRGGVG